MGFFSMHETCGVCGKDTGFDKRKIANKEYLCTDCFHIFRGLKPDALLWATTSEEIKDVLYFIKDNEEKLLNFKPTSKLGLIHIDEKNKQWSVHNRVFDYSELVEYELLENGTSVTKGGIGKAVVGGVLLGGVGAIVGGSTGKKTTKTICENLKLKITLSNMKNPIEYINLISTATKTGDQIYKQKYNLAQECISALQIIASQNEMSLKYTEGSSADEILKYKQLLDAKAITQEEYDAKKKQLLGL